MNEDENIVKVHRMNTILLILMSDIFLYMPIEGCSTGIIHHFV